MESQWVVVCGAVFFPGGRVLVGRRSSRRYLGHWEFPGGKVQRGETVRQALVRELYEEIPDLRQPEVEVGPMLYEESLSDSECRWEMITYACHLLRPPPSFARILMLPAPGTEHSALELLPPVRLGTLSPRVPSLHEKVLEKVCNYRGRGGEVA